MKINHSENTDELGAGSTGVWLLDNGGGRSDTSDFSEAPGASEPLGWADEGAERTTEGTSEVDVRGGNGISPDLEDTRVNGVFVGVMVVSATGTDDMPRDRKDDCIK